MSARLPECGDRPRHSPHLRGARIRGRAAAVSGAATHPRLVAAAPATRHVMTLPLTVHAPWQTRAFPGAARSGSAASPADVIVCDAVIYEPFPDPDGFAYTGVNVQCPQPIFEITTEAGLGDEHRLPAL